MYEAGVVHDQQQQHMWRASYKRLATATAAAACLLLLLRPLSRSPPSLFQAGRQATARSSVRPSARPSARPSGRAPLLWLQSPLRPLSGSVDSPSLSSFPHSPSLLRRLRRRLQRSAASSSDRVKVKTRGATTADCDPNEH